MENVCVKPSEKNSGDWKLAGNDLETLPNRQNLTDLGSRGATLHKMENRRWFEGPEWLLNENQWPEQPQLRRTNDIQEEHKPILNEYVCCKT